MLSNFDLHVKSGRLAVRRMEPDGRQWIELRNLSGEVIGSVDNNFLPQAPRWSPDGSKLAFAGNDGILYTCALQDDAPRIVFHDPPLQAGFCEWFRDGRRIAFSARGSQTPQPPGIYCLNEATGHAVQLTGGSGFGDRFPQPSPCGRLIAFHRQFLDEPDMPKKIYFVEVESGRCFPLPVEPGTDSRIGRFCWSPDSSHVLVRQERESQAHLKAVRLDDMATTWSGEVDMACDGAFAPGGNAMLCVCRDELRWLSFPGGKVLERLSLSSLAPVRDILTGPALGFDPDAPVVYFLGTDSCLYRWNVGSDCAPILQDVEQLPEFTREKYEVVSRDGRKVPVFRCIPPDPRSVAVMLVHGGPPHSGNWESIEPGSQDSLTLRLLQDGFEVVTPAYRGMDENKGEYGRADVWDVVECGLDWKRRTGGKRPLALAGDSYGGYLTFLALSQADAPWACGIALWPVTGAFGLHEPRWFPADPVEKAAAMIERSPLAQAGRIRVPLLIFGGALEGGMENLSSIQERVRAQGIECDLMIFDDDTHGLGRHRNEIHAKMVDFLRNLDRADVHHG